MPERCRPGVVTNMDNVMRTCLFEKHAALDARMTPFGGYEMPLQYQGILAEHHACRNSAAIFDTSHMGEIHVDGPDAADDLERLVSCPIASLAPGRCRYGLMCNPRGGVIDDLVVYRFDRRSFLLVVNAGTRAGDAAWVRDHVSPSTTVEDRSDQTAKVDLQGPVAPRIARHLLGPAIGDLCYFSFTRMTYRNSETLVSRTGYTGEAGIEFYAEPDVAVAFWDDCLARGAVPAGLGARDTLRLEMGMPLYGHELQADRNAAQSCLEWAIGGRKDFIGAPAIRDAGAGTECLVGLILDGRRAARAGDTIRVDDGGTVGSITSGSFGPSVGKAIALGYVKPEHSDIETRVSLGAAGLAATVVDMPFFTGGTAKGTWRETAYDT